MSDDRRPTVWDRLHEFALGRTGSFTSQDVTSWFGRHAPGQATESTIRVHTRGASWNVEDRAQFSHREPFLTKVDRGRFRRATTEEIELWRLDNGSVPSPRVDRPAPDAPAPMHVPGARRLDSLPEPHLTKTSEVSGEWHTGANIQSSLETALATAGWRIISVANAATKQHGIDVVATRHGQTAGIEVKGFPSRNYADPARVAETKRTSPST